MWVCFCKYITFLLLYIKLYCMVPKQLYQSLQKWSKARVYTIVIKVLFKLQCARFSYDSTFTNRRIFQLYSTKYPDSQTCQRNCKPKRGFQKVESVCIRLYLRRTYDRIHSSCLHFAWSADINSAEFDISG